MARNYELEDIKYHLRAKPVRDHPLVNNEGTQAKKIGGFGAQMKLQQLETKNYEANSTEESGEDNSDDEANGILERVKAVSDPICCDYFSSTIPLLNSQTLKTHRPWISKAGRQRS